MSDGAEERQRIVRRADIVRSKLMRTLEALGRKRHDALDVGLQLRRHAGGVAVVALVVAFSLGGATAALVVRMLPRPTRRRQRVSALLRAFRHPERVARTSDPFVPSFGKKVLLALTTTVVTQLAKFAAGRLLNQPRERIAASDTSTPALTYAVVPRARAIDVG
jgi:hypothetical protein